MIAGGIQGQTIDPETGDYTLFDTRGNTLYVPGSDMLDRFVSTVGLVAIKQAAVSLLITDSIQTFTGEPTSVVVDVDENGKLRDVTIF